MASDSAPLNRSAVLALMEARGIDSVAQLARRADMERSYLSRVLDGKRPAHPSHVLALARALKVAPIALLGPDDPDAATAALDDEPAA